MESRRAVLSGNASLTATLSSDYIDFYWLVVDLLSWERYARLKETNHTS